jgi:hypothetical protein
VGQVCPRAGVHPCQTSGKVKETETVKLNCPPHKKKCEWSLRVFHTRCYVDSQKIAVYFKNINFENVNFDNANFKKCQKRERHYFLPPSLYISDPA